MCPLPKIMAFKIYTKTGDKGKTGLIGGTRVSKGHIRIESYGTVDELNSYIGLVGDLLNDPTSKKVLREVQDRLFTIGSSLATDPGKDIKMAVPDLHDKDVEFLEQQIDLMNETLPDMRNFILPGGHPAVSTIHVSRCISRRAERICVQMTDEGELVEAVVIRYLNRLSDYLFTLARYIGLQLNIEEIPWKPRL